MVILVIYSDSKFQFSILCFRVSNLHPRRFGAKILRILRPIASSGFTFFLSEECRIIYFVIFPFHCHHFHPLGRSRRRRINRVAQKKIRILLKQYSKIFLHCQDLARASHNILPGVSCARRVAATREHRTKLRHAMVHR